MVDNISVKKHIKSLSFKTEEEYFSWCTQYGFSAIFPKTIHQLDKEFKLRQKCIYDDSMKKHRKIKTFKALIKTFRENKKSRDIKSSLKQEIQHNFIRYFEEAKNWGVEDIYLNMLEYLDKVSKLTKNNYFVEILAVVLRHENWLKNFESWKPITHNPDKQLSCLLRHLLVKYEVPLFMDSAWNRCGRDLHRDWFIFIGNGGNIRKAKGLPIPLTKKQANYFIQTPDHYTINQAFIFSQILSEGGSVRLADSIKETYLMDLNQNRNDFNLSVIKFFIRHPMLDLVHVGPIIDYIWNQKYVQTIDGIVQPNFSMNGRSPESLLNAVDRWHRQLGKEKKGGIKTWERCSIKEFEIHYGSAQKNTLKIWKIVELCSSKELTLEGRAQKSCVSSYAYSCVNKQCAIFSLRVGVSANIFEIKTTIEVRNRTICQIRNKYNKFPNKQEVDIINKWAKKEGLNKI